MNALLLIRSHMGTVYALGVVFLVAVALSALKFSIPDVIPGAELLVFGWLGVALGRLAVGAGADPVAPPKPETDPVAAPKPEAGAKSERLDAIVRAIVTLVQAQAKESDAFSERLNGANTRLAQQTDATSVRDIVLALIEDNRHMRDKLADVRDQLEDSKLQVLQLQNVLERSEEAGMRDAVTLIGNRRYFDETIAQQLERAHRTGETLLPGARRHRPVQAGQRSLRTSGGRSLFAALRRNPGAERPRAGSRGAFRRGGVRPHDAGRQSRERDRRGGADPQGPGNEAVGARTDGWTGRPDHRLIRRCGACAPARRARTSSSARTTGSIKPRARGRNCVIADSPDLPRTPAHATRSKRVANG